MLGCVGDEPELAKRAIDIVMRGLRMSFFSSSRWHGLYNLSRQFVFAYRVGLHHFVGKLDAESLYGTWYLKGWSKHSRDMNLVFAACVIGLRPMENFMLNIARDDRVAKWLDAYKHEMRQELERISAISDFSLQRLVHDMDLLCTVSELRDLSMQIAHTSVGFLQREGLS